MTPAAVVRIACRAYPDDDAAAVLMPGGWRLAVRGRWVGPRRLTRGDAEADAHAQELAPLGRATSLTAR